jgi:hypothetical protein
MNDSINLTEVPTLIIFLETVYGDPDYITIVDRKLEALKESYLNFSTDDTAPIEYLCKILYTHTVSEQHVQRCLSTL